MQVSGGHYHGRFNLNEGPNPHLRDAPHPNCQTHRGARREKVTTSERFKQPALVKASASPSQSARDPLRPSASPGSWPPAPMSPPSSAPAASAGHDLLRAAALAFAEADTDGDQTISMSEFRHLLPSTLRSTGGLGSGTLTPSDAALYELFEMADSDRSGSISISEFFFWSMACATDHAGVSLRSAFEAFDSSGDGKLNLQEVRAPREP